MTSVAQVLHVTQIVGVLALLSSIFDWITLDVIIDEQEGHLAGRRVCFELSQK